MNEKWIVFEGRPFPPKALPVPRVTIGSTGVIFLNRHAVAALGSPAAVELRYDAPRRLIGIKPADPSRENAFHLRRHAGTYLRIAAAAFCRHFRVKIERTQVFESVEINPDGMMILDLNRTMTVTRVVR